MDTILTIAAVLVLALPLFLLQIAADAYSRFRGRRTLTCPETRKPVVAEIDALHAAASTAVTGLDLRIRHCSRWPEREGCDQGCLAQVEGVPKDRLTRSLVSRWWERKSCALCGRRLEKAPAWVHEPTLVDEDGLTHEWSDLPNDELADLHGYRPVCESCHVVESFRRVYPELVIDRHRTVERPHG